MENLQNHQNYKKISLYYFLWFGGVGFVFPFMSLVYKQNGLNGTQIGLLSTLSACAALLAGPLWGRLCDRTGQPVKLIRFLIVGTAVAVLGIGLQNSFWGYALAVPLYAAVGAGLGPLADSLSMTILKQMGGKLGYGAVRRFGSLGWIVVVLLGSQWIERTSIRNIFPGSFVVYLLALVPLLVLQPVGEMAQKVRANVPLSMFGTLRSIFTTRVLVGLAIAQFTVWLATFGPRTFQTLFLDQLGATPGVIGIATVTSAMVELFAMTWADRWVSRYSPAKALLVVWGIDTIRFVTVLLFPHVMTIILVNALGGISFSLFSVAFLNFILRNAPAGQNSMALALFNVTLMNLISVIGGPLAGGLYDWLGGAYWLYAIAACGNVLGLILFYWISIRKAKA
jgi:PPP family 3-phenylpropionic acid transporter